MNFVKFGLFAFLIGFFETVSAEIPLSSNRTEKILSEVLKQTQNDETRLMLKTLYRTSPTQKTQLLSSHCAYPGASMKITCTYQIGTDDLTDDDSGWGSVYELSVEVIEGRVVSELLTLIAG